MTFRSASLIDGALVDAAVLRIGSFMAGGRYEGVATGPSLKVKPLTTPGNGVTINAGAGLVVNRYQASPDQAYIVSNVGDVTLGSADMPPVSTSDRSHLVCVTVGDPEFSQVGHPWMPGTIPAGSEETFQYVRPYIIQNVPAGTKSFAELNRSYPAYALARIDIPKNTTTITSAMIVDLRDIPLPRSSERIEHIAGPATKQTLNGESGVAGAYQNFPNSVNFQLDIPLWASRAYITGFVEGVRVVAAGTGKIRVSMGGAVGAATTSTSIDEAAPGGGSNGIRTSYNLGGEIAIPDAAKGTTVTVRIEATPNTNADKGFLTADSSASGQIRVRLAEQAS
jgi:hypothetical protein